MSALDLAGDVAAKLRGGGFQAFLVGGCVRDRLLGLVPADFDVSTDAHPEQVLQLIPRAQLVGAHFGVVVVRDEVSGIPIEVATFRRDGNYTDGRRPDDVQFVSAPEIDARRRDFTINGLFENLDTGDVLDFVGGRADLKAGLIRAIGDPLKRFREDHLRMLRAIRFAARLGFEVEAATLSAIQQEAYQITNISVERIRDELVRLLTEGSARAGLEWLDRAGLLAYVLPQVKAFQGVEQPPEFHPEGDVWTHVLLMLENMRQPPPTLAMGVLLHDVGKPATFRVAERIRFDGHAELGATITHGILDRLKFSNDQVTQTVSLVANHMKFKDVKNMRASTLKRFLRLPHFDQHLELHRLDCLASNGQTDAYNYVLEKRAQLGEEQLRPPRLLTGQNLIEAGYTPGPMFRTALAVVENAQLDGEVHTVEQALALARRVLDPDRPLPGKKLPVTKYQDDQ